MSKTISCQETAALMASAGLFAIFDVRERGEYNDGQIPNSTSLPRSQIEFRIAELVPSRKITMVVYDECGPRAELAAATLTGLGYEDVVILCGGLAEWQSEGRAVVSGVNVPSKGFGEIVHHDRQVPDLGPEDLQKLIDDQTDLTILDVRTPEEYGRFCIPGGINVPGGDLILWADELRQKPTVIVNCAGRTRSIIGTAALRRLGLTNVRALRNGTMGWVLAGLPLETKPARRGPAASMNTRAAALVAAQRIAAEENIAWISADDATRLSARKTDGVSYLLDVRSEEEFASGHVAGAISLPGGQAVQRADDFVPVRAGTIVFISNDSARAVMAAYWYKQMGFPNVFVLQGGLNGWQACGRSLVSGSATQVPRGFAAAKDAARLITAADLLSRLEKKMSLIFDVGSSLEFESAHVPGARWISRGWLDVKLPELCADRRQSIVLTCPDGQQSIFGAAALKQLGYADVAVLDGGVRAWSSAGYPIDSGLNDCLVPPNDVVLSPSIRGSKEDMQKYLDWELKLKH
jgi:rhodanese-related sulfurtransferase